MAKKIEAAFFYDGRKQILQETFKGLRVFSNDFEQTMIVVDSQDTVIFKFEAIGHGGEGGAASIYVEKVD